MRKLVLILIIGLLLGVGCSKTQQEKRITELIEPLGASLNWVEREGAARNLIRIGEPALPFLRKVTKGKSKESETRWWRARYIIAVIERRPKTPADIDRMFNDYVNEKFYKLSKIASVSGWTMELPSGGTVIRATLDQQADSIIAYGPEAIPHLFKWVMSEYLHVRYIAVYSLEEITSLKSHIGTFDKEDRDGCREEAIKIWKEWWEKNKNNQ